MNLKTKRFLYQIFTITAIMLILTFVLQITNTFFITAHYLSVVIPALLTIGIFLLTQKSSNKSTTSSFINIFIATSTAKLFILLAYIAIYLFTVGENKFEFIIFLLINYIVFSFTEVYFILKANK